MRANASARTRAIFQSECNVITSEYMFTRFYSFLFFKGFLPYYETVDMLQFERAVFIRPPNANSGRISIFYPEMDAIRQASYNDPNQLQRSNGWAFMHAI